MCLAHDHKHAALAQTITKELRQFEHWRARSATEPTSSACYVHQFYSHAERLLLLLTWKLPGKTVRGINWPQRLLHEAALEIAGVRPAVISLQTQTELQRFLLLRNLRRNIYGYEPAPCCLTLLLREALALYPRFMHELSCCHAMVFTAPRAV